MKEVLVKEYNNLEQLNIPFKKESYSFNIHFLEGGFIEILGRDKSKNFLVQFINQNNNEIIYESNLTPGMWSKTAIKYFVNFLVKVIDLSTNKAVHEHKYNAENKRVYIHLDSSAIGDTLAWFPYVEEFRKKHNCRVICSTFHNEWFESEYPEIEFVKPGTTVNNLYAMYSVGWHYNENGEVNTDFNPTDFKTYSLQECSADVLGIDYKEIKPKLSFRKTLQIAPIEGKYVVIAPHGSAHAKYWNRPGGWQAIIDYLNNEGYKVVMITQEPLGDEWHDSKLGGTLTGVIDKTGDNPLEDRATDMMNAEFFIGIGSGLSWLNWALGGKTVLISGFSAPFSEFTDCERVFTPSSSICNSCFNKTRLDAGDWEWCPEHKNTERHFECTKTITPDMVIEAIERVRNS
jgi:autotransporter strand-loop-strand O-heptosyltransferase